MSGRLLRISVPALGVAVVIVAGLALVGTKPRSSDHPPGRATAKPNIVFILTDDLSWDLVDRRFAPHIVALQRRGETFDHHFVADSLCCPSRAAILTGRFPHNTRVVSNTAPLGG